jgi:hypothetical protein
MMHPYFIGAFAAERQAQMMADAEITRLARQAGSEHRRTHFKTVPGRWTRRFTMGRIRTWFAAQIRFQEAHPARRAPGTTPAP